MKYISKDPLFSRIRDILWNYPYFLFHFLKLLKGFRNPIIFLFIIIVSSLLLLSLYNNLLQAKGMQNILYVGVVDNDQEYNPLLSNHLDKTLNKLIFNTLYTIDSKNIPHPLLASSWEFKNSNTEIIFNLQHPIYWQDGKELTAEDLVYTFNLQRKINPNSLFGKIIMTKIDDYSLKIDLPSIDVNIWQDLYVPIFSANNSNIVGTGPYKLKSKSDGKFTLTSNDNYFKNKPNIQNLVLNVYPKQSDLITAYNEGYINTMEIEDPETLTAKSLNTIKDNVSSKSLGTNYYMLAINNKKVSDLNIRKAINYSIDKEKIVKSLNGFATPLYGPIDPNSWAYSLFSENSKYDWNPESAYKSFLDAGYGKINEHLYKNNNILALTFAYQETDNPNIINSIIEDLKSIGVEVTPIKYSSTDWISTVLTQKDFDLAYIEVQSSIDPDPISLWKSDSPINIMSYSNKSIDRILALARNTTDINERKLGYTRFQNLLINDRPCVFLYTPDMLLSTRKNIKNIAIDENLAFEEDYFNNIQDWSF